MPASRDYPIDRAMGFDRRTDERVYNYLHEIWERESGGDPGHTIQVYYRDGMMALELGETAYKGAITRLQEGGLVETVGRPSPGRPARLRLQIVPGYVRREGDAGPPQGGLL